MGGDCEFLGFPYGGGWRTEVDGTSYWLPFVKHCTLSNLGVGNRGESKDARITVGDKKVWILDGINNHGFSGGPVIVNTFGAQRIMAVVSGYITDPEDVIDSSRTRRHPTSQTAPSHPKQRVDANSGFIVAFDIIYAIEAINKNPIGPLRTN
jgi:hypothetical protein